MSELTYRGVSLLGKDVEMTFSGTLTDEGLSILDGMVRRTSPAKREIRMDLDRGQRWPASVKRGKTLRLDINGRHYEGPVRYRYAWRVVVDAEA